MSFKESDHPRWPEGSGDKSGEFRGTGASFKLRAKSSILKKRRERLASRGFEDATDADKKRLSVPPAWTEVMVDRSPGAPLLAAGLDGKGREQAKYSREHHEKQAAEKFARIEELNDRIEEIDRRIARDAKDDDTALAALLISRMGLRPGSDTDTGAEKKAHGATNLKASHIKTTPNGRINASFTGKKGVDLDLALEDSELARLLESRKQGKGGGDRLLQTDERKLREYMKNAAPGVKPKDLRTHLGTTTAKKLVDSMPTPKTAKEYQRQRREVGKRVGEILGNTATVALESYIAPSVFARWDIALKKAK